MGGLSQCTQRGVCLLSQRGGSVLSWGHPIVWFMVPVLETKSYRPPALDTCDTNNCHATIHPVLHGQTLLFQYESRWHFTPPGLSIKAELALLCSSGGLIPQIANTPEIRVAHWAFVHIKPPLPVLLHTAWPREALGMNVTCAARHVHGRRRVCSRIKAHYALPFGLLFWNPLQRRRNDRGQSCHSWHVPWSNLNLG